MSRGLQPDSLSDVSIVQLVTRAAHAQRHAAIKEAVTIVVRMIVKLVSRRGV